MSGIMMYVFDPRWPVAPTPAAHPGRVVRKTIVQQSDWIETVVQRILAAKKHEEKIELLRLCAHGAPGGLQLGLGLNIYFAKHLRPLASQLEGFCRRIELHACQAAGSTSTNPTAGVDFLKEIAKHTNTMVTAGKMLQRADPLFNWEGSTITAYPDGGICDNCPPPMVPD